MKTRYCHYKNRYETFTFDSPGKFKDSWGTEWEADSFRLERCSGKSIYIRYMKNGLPLFEVRKIVKFVPGEDWPEKDAGIMRIIVDGKYYDIGTWEIKDEEI